MLYQLPSGFCTIFCTITLLLSLLLDRVDITLVCSCIFLPQTWLGRWSSVVYVQKAAHMTPQTVVASDALTCSSSIQENIWHCLRHVHLLHIWVPQPHVFSVGNTFYFFCLYSLSTTVHCGPVSSRQIKVSQEFGLRKWLPEWCWIIIFLIGLQYSVLKCLLTLVPILYLNYW